MAIHYKIAAGQPDFTTEVPQGPSQFESPMGAARPDALVITQVYMQRWAYYNRPSENAACPAGIGQGVAAYFCEDSPRVPVGRADLVTWTRTWATVPPQVREFVQLVVQLPARCAVYRFDIGTPGGEFQFFPYLAAKSSPLPRLARLIKHYILVGTSGSYANPESIPQNNETIYTGADRTGLGTGPLTNAQITSFTAQNLGLFSGAVLDPNLNYGFGGFTGGTGNATYVANALAAGDYYVGQSQIARYRGNIWERTTTVITL